MNDYPADWTDIATAIKDKAEWRCERCGVRHETKCPDCAGDGVAQYQDVRFETFMCGTCGGKGQRGRVLTVHHLDGDKANCADWNLAALCQRCHLSIQGRVINFYQGFLFEHSPWMQKHVEAYRAATEGAA